MSEREPVSQSGAWRVVSTYHDGDRIIESPYPPRGFLGGTIKGQKPTEFSYWVFGLLGASPGDEVVDLFPGSGAVGHAWDGYCQQLRLAI